MIRLAACLLLGLTATLWGDLAPARDLDEGVTLEGQGQISMSIDGLPNCESYAVVRPSPIEGNGVFARRAIAAGTRVIEYVGEKVSKAESNARCEANNVCIFALDEEHDLDGNVPWNPARFVNHSCAPNCEAIEENGCIWIVAWRDIAAGEELTFNYGYDLVDYREQPCHCGAAACVGFIVAEEFFEHVRRQCAL